MNLATAYQLVASVASPSESEGLTKERAILLLWYLRNAMGIDDLDAYEYICDGNDDQGVDGLYLEPAGEDDEKSILHVFQSKYPVTPKSIGVKDVRAIVGVAASFQSVEALDELWSGALEPELRELLKRFEVKKLLARDQLEVRLVLVCAGKLTPEARRLERATNQKHGSRFLKCVDVFDLAPVIEAFRSPATVSGEVTVSCSHSERFVASIGNGRVAVCRLPVKELVTWPGIADRKLFELNVRRELRRNKVRKAIDRAIARKADHANFLAFHNGITVICERFDDSSSSKLVVKNMSVVNGAQSTVAFFDNSAELSDDLRIVAKFVEVPPDRQVAREVAVRSNTQNPVNARNLRARDGIQLRLEAEFRDQYPSIVYETRPDASISENRDVIQNDDAAQLLCAVYNQQPWVAIRRLSLFESERYPTIFTSETTPSMIVLVDRLARKVQEEKRRFPEEYLKSWRLTKLVAVYLVGQVLRTNSALTQILEEPREALRSTSDLDRHLDRLPRFAAAAMKMRRDELSVAGEVDNFKVDFKREDALKDLANRARQAYIAHSTIED